MRVRLVGADLAATLLFVALGVHAHHHREAVLEILDVWYPFAIGVVVAALGRRRTTGLRLIDGVVSAAITVATAMVLRTFNGQGTDVAFTVVAFAFVTLFFSLWRGALQLLQRRR